MAKTRTRTRLVDRYRLWSTSASAIAALGYLSAGCGNQPSATGPQASAALAATWVPQGPAPILNGQARVAPLSANNPVAGCVQGLAPDPSNANIMYVAAVNGGIWRTTNALAASPSWTPLIDFEPSLSMGAVATDATNTQVIAGGTGRWSSFGNNGNAQGFIYVSRDGGSTFTTLTDPLFADQKLGGIAIRGNTILVTTPDPAGLVRTADNGAHWTQISGGPGTGLPFGGIFDLAEDRTNPNRFYVTVNGTGIFRSTDQGATWTNISQNDPGLDAAMHGGNTVARASVSRNDGRLYVGVVPMDGQGNGPVNFVAYTRDQGASWVDMSAPNIEVNGIPFGMFAFAADPVNSSFVYVAGPGDWMRGDAGLTPPSPVWQSIAYEGTQNFTAPHSDSRRFAFDANSDLILVEDGGVFKRTRPRENTGDWYSLAGNLQSAEVHNVAYDSNSHDVLAGTQDNGSVYQIAAGQLAGLNITGGDGGDVDVDAISTPGFSFRYTSSQDLGGFRRGEYDAAGNLVSEVFPALRLPSGSSIFSDRFVTPVEINKVNGFRLLIALSDTVYESFDQAEDVTPVGGAPEANNMVYGHPNNPDVIWAVNAPNPGRHRPTGDVWIRLAAGGPLVPTPTHVTDNPSDVVLDSADFRRAYVISPFQVWVTPDAGATWTEITGDLQSFNPGFLNTIEFIPGPTRNLVIVGASEGVFSTTTDQLGSWQVLGPDLPKAPVTDAQFSVADNQLAVGLLGRGAWTAAGLSQ